MPGRQGRHARGKESWGGQPPRSAERAGAAQEPDIRPPGKKNRWAKCKGNRGGPHVPVIVFSAASWHVPSCRWGVTWGSGDAYVPRWCCWHREECQHCGKVFRDRVPEEECPQRAAGQAGYAGALAEAARVTAQHAGQRRRFRQRVPDGPQGYRRPRGTPHA